jgi:hypothetical protein
MGRQRCWMIAAAAAALLAGCGSSIGSSCTTDQDCGGRTCRLLPQASFPGGYCTETCVLSDSGSCPTGATCVDHDGSSICLRACADDTECRSGYVCLTYRSAGAFCLTPTDG